MLIIKDRYALESKLNPLIALGRTGSLGLSSLVNKFNSDAELLDDLVSVVGYLPCYTCSSVTE
jgi:hypothetical protein